MKSFVLSPNTAHIVHFFFEWLAIAIGIQVYRIQRSQLTQPGLLDKSHFGVIVACILGAALGNKLVFWLEFPHLWKDISTNMALIFSGQSIVGGLLGGLLGVEIAKKLLHQNKSTGDYFVLPILLGTVIGRIGCFLAGLNDGTFGDPTSLIIGVDFGDGIARHPTQIYEIIFVSLWGTWLLKHRAHWLPVPGLMFKLYLAGYLLWRLAIDGIKPKPFLYAFSLSGIQVVCIIALALYLPLVWRDLRKLRHQN